MAGSWASSEQSRRAMTANRSKDTKPELAVRSLLHAYGLRYRVHYRPDPLLRRTADIVFTRRKVAVFVDGCFWHACPEHFVMPRANSDYWVQKIARNQLRDADTNRALQAVGWTVLRFWEHESPSEVVETILEVTADASRGY